MINEHNSCNLEETKPACLRLKTIQHDGVSINRNTESKPVNVIVNTGSYHDNDIVFVLRGTNELIEWVRIDYVSESEAYESMPEGDEFNIEEDEDFEEVLGALGFPEDETELFDAEYQGRKVPLNKPMRGDVKKFKVYVKDPSSGNVKKVNFGHGGTSAKRPTMRIRKSNPKARKSFRARHNCANPGPKTKARYWSCRKW